MHDPSATPTLDATLADTRRGTQPGRRRNRVVAVGQAIGRYVVLDRLGAGGMGVVFAAYDPQLDRKVAVKLLKQAGHADGGGTAGDRDRLLEEARALAQLAHPNVIAVHDVGVHDGEVFVAMEFIDGVTLAAWQRADGRTTSEVLGVYLAAGAGLSAAHRAGLVHRDFKPDNVMVDRGGRARVLDFGLARPSRNKPDLQALGEAAPDAPETLATIGTPAYMAPEQFAGERVDARSDQFAFCVALYEALYGERPFRGETVAEVATSTLEQHPAFTGPVLDVPTRVAAALHRGLEKNPQERFADMETLLRELDDTPGHTPRWLLGLGFAGIVGGLAAVAAFAPEQRDEDPCPRARAVDGVWGPVELATVERAFTTEDGLDVGAFEMSRRRLDRHALALHTHELGVCNDIEAGRTLPAEAKARRMCLDRRTHQLEGLIALADASPETLRRRPDELLATLQTAASCAGTGGDEDIVDEARLERFDSLMTDLDSAYMRLTGGDLDEPRDRIEEILGQAEKEGQRWIEARAHVMLGQAADQKGDPTAARDHFKQAFRAGLAAGHTTAASDAAILLAQHRAWHGELDAAEYWLSLADAFAERHPLRDKRLVELQSTRGSIAEARGDVDKARDAFAEAVATCRDLFGDRSASCLVDWSRLADARAATGEVDEALENYEDIVDLQTERFGRDHPTTAAFLQGHAMALRHATHFDAAIGRMQEAIDASIAVWGADGPRLASMYGNHAAMLGDVGRLDEATAALDRAIEIQQRVDGDESLTMSYAYALRGRFRALLGEADDAEADLVRATTIREETFGDETNPLTITAHRIHAEARLVAGRPDKALESTRTVLSACKTIDTCHDSGIAAHAVRVASLAALDRAEEARQALDELRGMDKRSELAKVYAAVAEWVVHPSEADKAALCKELERVGGRGNLTLAWLRAQP